MTDKTKNKIAIFDLDETLLADDSSRFMDTLFMG